MIYDMGITDDDFYLYNEVRARKDPEGAEWHRKEHEKYMKWKRKVERRLAFRRTALKWASRLLKWAIAAAVAFVVEKMLSEYVI